MVTIFFLFLMSMGDYYFFIFSSSFLFLFYLLNLSGFMNLFLLNFDIYSSLLIILSLLICILMTLSSLPYYIYSNFKNYFSMVMVMLIVFLFLCFSLSNFFYFYVMFECVVIPVFMLILGWGYSTERLQAGMYMFLYTFFASLPFLITLIYIFNFLKSFNYLFINQENYFFYLNNLWWNFMLVVFMVKLPIFLVHLWLPKAHVEAPLVGSMILAGVMLKLGGYGILKSFLFSSKYFYFFKNFLLSFCMMGAIYISIICMRQFDLKSLVAYSSVVHMGFILLSMVIISWGCLWGAVMMLLAHGISSSSMFFLLTSAYERVYSRSVLVVKGGLMFFPMFSFWWFLLILSNMSFPPSFNFFSELMIMSSSLWYSYSIMLVVIFNFLFSGFFSIYFYFIMNHGMEKFINYEINFSIREYLVMLSHFFPLMLVFFVFLNF